MRQLLSVIAFVVVWSFVGAGSAAAADFVVASSGQGAYVINGQPNPTLSLTRGRTYTFDVTASASGHPFWIKTVPETGTDDSFDSGVTNNGVSPGLLTFAVPNSAPPPGRSPAVGEAAPSDPARGPSSGYCSQVGVMPKLT
jgi:hypothetical protein